MAHLHTSNQTLTAHTKLEVREDFRTTFSKLDDLALINIDEFAALLTTSRRSVEQMRFRKALPPTVEIPGLRRCLWTAGTVRAWIAQRSFSAQETHDSGELKTHITFEEKRGPGRPRKPLVQV